MRIVCSLLSKCYISMGKLIIDTVFARSTRSICFVLKILNTEYWTSMYSFGLRASAAAVTPVEMNVS